MYLKASVMLQNIFSHAHTDTLSALLHPLAVDKFTISGRLIK